MQFSQAILLVFIPNWKSTQQNQNPKPHLIFLLTGLKSIGGAAQSLPYLVLYLIIRSHHKVSAFHHNTRQHVRAARSCAIGGVEGQVKEEEGAGRLTAC